MAVYPQGSPNPPGNNQQMSVAQQIKQQIAMAKQQQMAQHYASMLGAQAQAANQQAQGTQSPDNQVRVQVNKMTGPARRLIKLILTILGTVSLHTWLVWGRPDLNSGDTVIGWAVSIFIAGVMWVFLHGAANYVLRGDPFKGKDD